MPIGPIIFWPAANCSWFWWNRNELCSAADLQPWGLAGWQHALKNACLPLKWKKKGNRHAGQKGDFTLKGTYQPCLVSGRRSRVLRSRWDTCKKPFIAAALIKPLLDSERSGQLAGLLRIQATFFSSFFFLPSFFFYCGGPRWVCRILQFPLTSNWKCRQKKVLGLWWIEDGGRFLPCPPCPPCHRSF